MHRISSGSLADYLAVLTAGHLRFVGDTESWSARDSAAGPWRELHPAQVLAWVRRFAYGLADDLPEVRDGLDDAATLQGALYLLQGQSTVFTASADVTASTSSQVIDLTAHRSRRAS